MRAIHLSDRGVVSIAGADAASLLQGVVTCDVPAAATGGAAYGALLTPQGKLLFDFILHRHGDGFVADLPRAAVEDFLKRLKLYRLRAKVELADCSGDLAVVQVVGAEAGERPAGQLDPRHSRLGNRLVLATEEAAQLADEAGAAPLEDYHARRIALAVPEAPYDFAYGEVFPHDVAMDCLGGIAFKKGCFVGQEVVSRIQHRGTARRRVVRVSAAGELPQPGTAIVAGERPVGTLGSRAGGEGIAVVRLDRARPDDGALMCGDVAVSLTIPDWASYSWPEHSPSAAE